MQLMDSFDLKGFFYMKIYKSKKKTNMNNDEC